MWSNWYKTYIKANIKLVQVLKSLFTNKYWVNATIFLICLLFIGSPIENVDYALKIWCLIGFVYWAYKFFTIKGENK